MGKQDEFNRHMAKLKMRTFDRDQLLALRDEIDQQLDEKDRREQRTYLDELQKENERLRQQLSRLGGPNEKAAYASAMHTLYHERGFTGVIEETYKFYVDAQRAQQAIVDVWEAAKQIGDTFEAEVRERIDQLAEVQRQRALPSVAAVILDAAKMTIEGHETLLVSTLERAATAFNLKVLAPGEYAASVGSHPSIFIGSTWHRVGRYLMLQYMFSMLTVAYSISNDPRLVADHILRQLRSTRGLTMSAVCRYPLERFKEAFGRRAPGKPETLFEGMNTAHAYLSSGESQEEIAYRLGIDERRIREYVAWYKHLEAEAAQAPEEMRAYLKAVD